MTKKTVSVYSPTQEFSENRKICKKTIVHGLSGHFIDTVCDFFSDSIALLILFRIEYQKDFFPISNNAIVWLSFSVSSQLYFFID